MLQLIISLKTDDIALAKPSANALTSANAAVRNATGELATAQANETLVAPVATNIRKAFDTMATNDMVEIIGSLQGQPAADYLISEAGIQTLKDKALVNAAGEFMMGTRTLQTMADGVATHAKFMEAALAFRQVIPTTESLTAAVTAKQAALRTAQNALNALMAKDALLGTIGTFGKVGATMSTTAGLIASKCWGSSGSYNAEKLNKGIRDNVIANMHQVSLVGGSYVITTPSKNVIYHTYIKDVPQDKVDVTIFAVYDDDDNSYTSDRTMTFALKAFRDHKNLKTVCFHSMEDQSSNAGVPMLFTIPDSAFVGCDNLVEFSTLLKDNEGGTRPLGPENFILGGDSIFAGLDPAKFHILIDPSRKDDFLESESWKPLERYFAYKEAMPVAKLTEYGAKYAFAYENNSILRENKVSGHRIQHTEVIGADDKFITEHQGALKLCNDIGEWHNYQLDAVHRKAFMGNENLKVVNFTDLFGKGAFGTSYTGLEVSLGDSCFANCKNLVNLDLLYLVTDGTNYIDPIKPSQVKIGNGILDGTTARIKMMPEQVEWFEADTTWAKYKDRFLPCIIHPSDEGIKKALKPMAYYDMAHEGNDWKLWDDYIDLARLGGAGFSWLDGKFREQRDNILSFYDFKHFDSVGLDYVGKEWFRGCRKMSNIQLPKTIKTIQSYAFASCDKLTEIKLPASVEKIEECAFADCKTLNSIFVEAKKPAQLGSNAFEKNAELKIYVPAASLNDYLSAWAEYKDYIVSDKDYKVNKVVTVKEMGKLAEALGLYVEWSNSGTRAGNEPRYIHGNYSKYDSLTVVGPLNTLDLWVIRYLAGNNGYERGTVPTDGQLRYLNLYNADIKKDSNCDANYINLSTLIFHNGWMDVVEDNALPAYLFYKCTPLETVILPKSLKKISGRIFEGCSNLKHLAITSPLEDYDEKLYIGGIIDYPLEELVFVGEGKANSTRKDPWGKTLLAVYTTNAQYTNYLNDPCVINHAKDIIAPFEDDAIWTMMARHGEFFPSLIAEKEDVGRIFSEASEEKKLKTFDEFQFFNKVKRLDETFYSNECMERISIPASVRHISADAFVNCVSLKTIKMKGDTVPELAADAFRSLPKDFVIYVPRGVEKVYRTKWAQYADHINPEMTSAANDEIKTITLTEPNTLASKLGLTTTETSGTHNFKTTYWINSVRGDYSKITRLKIVGPISGADLLLLRYLSGFCPWSNSRNYMGHLEYLDLYDAELKTSNYWVGPDVVTSRTLYVEEENVLPAYSFLQCYNLKTLILPRTLKKVNSRALQQCEALETLVLGDDMEEFNWDALDDDASLTRMYILSKKKMNICSEFVVWRWLCNNYNPTFDAFYVRPSQYQEYLDDPAYTGSSWQRTNNISKGAFEDDDAFAAFASHAAATPDELITISSVDGWFDAHPGVKDLTPLRFTAIDSLKKATVAPLTKLEKVAMPYTLIGLEDGLFEKAKGLRYADFLFCDSTEIVSKLHDGAFKRLGINTDQTLVYVPSTYGESDGTNIVVHQLNGQFKAKAFRMIDSLNYMVPYAFETEKVVNTRSLSAAAVPYTMCVPYKVNVPAYSRAYTLSNRDGNTLVFKEVEGELEALKPYLLKVVGNKRLRKTSSTLNTEIKQTIPASNATTYGHQVDAAGYTLRGTFEGIDNKTANELGAYVLQSDGNWHPVASSTEAEKKACILPFRAYLLSNTHGANASISMELEDVDGIDTIETIDADGTEHYYDLQGRELPGKPSKGIYIHNGKKVVAN